MARVEEDWNDPCKCGHSFEAHGEDGGECSELGCECEKYRADTSWTDDLDDQDYLDMETR